MRVEISEADLPRAAAGAGLGDVIERHKEIHRLPASHSQVGEGRSVHLQHSSVPSQSRQRRRRREGRCNGSFGLLFRFLLREKRFCETARSVPSVWKTCLVSSVALQSIESCARLRTRPRSSLQGRCSLRGIRRSLKDSKGMGVASIHSRQEAARKALMSMELPDKIRGERVWES